MPNKDSELPNWMTKATYKKKKPINPIPGPRPNDAPKMQKRQPKTNTSRQASLTAHKRGTGPRVVGVPNNGAGIDYVGGKNGEPGKWIDNKGRTFATAPQEDSKLTRTTPIKETALAKAARMRRLSNAKRS